MAAPIGNSNAKRGFEWRNAINRALAKRDEREKGQALANLAEKLLTAAENGDISALRELGDRLDGKSAQQVIVAGDTDQPLVSELTVRLVHANRDSGPA